MSTIFRNKINKFRNNIIINRKYIYLQEEYLGFVARLILHVRELSKYFNIYINQHYIIFTI